MTAQKDVGPLCEGASVHEPEPWKPPCEEFCEEKPTPRKEVAPMWTSAEVVPASICFAMDSAESIGIAKACTWLLPWDWDWNE